MDRYDLTQEQWDEMVITELKETQKDLDAGTAVLIPYKEVRAGIMRRIEEIAEKEHAKTAQSYQICQPYESDTVSV